MMKYERYLLVCCLNIVLCASTGAQIRSRGGSPIKPRGPAASAIKLVKTLKLLPPVSAAHISAVSPNGKLLALGDTATRGVDDYAIKLFDAETGKLLHRLVGHTRPIESLAFSPDGTILASGSFEFIRIGVLRGEARLWDVKTGSLLHVLKGSNTSLEVAFSPDSSTVATATRTGIAEGTRQSDTESDSMEVMLWDTRSGRQVQTLTGRVESDLRDAHVEFSPNGQLLAATNSATINLWSLSSGTLIRTIKNETGSGFFRFSSSGTLLETEGGCAYGSLGINLWDVRTGNLLQTIDPTIGYPPSRTDCPNGGYWFTVFSEDEQQITAISDDSLRTWDIQSGRLKRKVKLLPRPILLGEPKRFIDRKTLITIDGDGVARWWEITDF